jgi:hypothetical protein
MKKIVSIVFLLSLVLLTGCERSNPSQYYITLEEDGTRCVVVTSPNFNKIQAMSCDWK